MSRRRKKAALFKICAGARLGAAERRYATASLHSFRQRFRAELKLKTPRASRALHDTILSMSR
jgi:hypothetical protein